MIRVRRIDSGRLAKAHRTPQGYLRAPARVTRTGVLVYRNADGTTRRELRHPDDVFDPKSLATLKGIPFTDLHPNATNPKIMLLNEKNTRDFIAGYTGDEIGREDDHVTAFVTILDDGLIKKIESGEQVEVSCGYTCDREEVPGIYNGEAYDVRQRNIEYNHLSSVPIGRAGASVRIHLDSADAVQVDPNHLEEVMEKITIDGVEYEVSPQVAQAHRKAEKARIDAEQKARADADAKLKSETERASKAEARADAAQSDLTKAQAELKARTDAGAPEVVRKAAKELVRIETVARRTLAKEDVARLDTMAERDIKVAVIKAESSDKSLNLDGKDASYIDARFDAIAEKLAADPEGDDKGLGKDLDKSRHDGAEPDADKARAAMLKREQDRWKDGAAK